MPEGFRIASAYVSVSPDLGEFEEELKAKLDAAASGASAKVRITGDSAGLDRAISDAAGKLAALDGTEARARITADSDVTLKAGEAKAKLDQLDGKTSRPRIELDDAAFRRQLAEDEAEARAFGSSSFHPLIAAATAGITASLPGIGGAVASLAGLGAAGGLAFSGIGGALQAASQQAQTAGQSSAQLAATEFSNSVAVQNAQQAVAQARQQSARDAITSAQQVAAAEAQLAVTERDSAAQQVQALESVAAAHHQVGQAEYTLSQAQYQLSQAWVQARQNLVALNDQLANQKLGVQAAQLAVEQAELNQRQVDANAMSTDLQRQQAALAVAQAKQQLKDATDSEAATQQQANQANKQGVDGSQQVIQAKQAVAQAQYGLAQSQQAYADAQAALTRTELDNAAQVKAAQQQVAQARQQAAYQQQADAQRISQAEQSLSDTLRQQQLQMAASGGAASALQQKMAALSPQAREAAFQILAMRGALHQLQATAQAAVLPGFTVLLEGVQSVLPEVNAGIAVFGQQIGNTFAQAGRAMETSGFRQELGGLIENGIALDQQVVPGIEHVASALLDAGSQKGAVDGLASGLRGIEDGVTAVIDAVIPFEGDLNTVLSSVGTVADAAGKPLGTLVGVVAGGLSPALQALDPVVLQVGGDLVTVFTAARPVLTEAGQIIADLTPGASEFATVLSGTLVGALDAVGIALRPVDAFLSSGFGRVIAGEVGFVLPALGLWKLANGALGLEKIPGAISAGTAALRTWTASATAAATVDAAMAAEAGAATAGTAGFAVAADGTAVSVDALTASESAAAVATGALDAAMVALDAVNPLVWFGAAAAGAVAVAVAVSGLHDRTQSYIDDLTQQDHATGFNIAGYEQLSAQLKVAAQAQDQHTAALYRAGAAGKASAGVTAVSAQSARELTAAQVQAGQEADRLSGSLTYLEQRYGLTAVQAEQLATAAGVQAKTLADGGSAADKAMAKITAYAQANINAHNPVAQTNQDFATLANNALTASSRTNALDDAFNALVGNFVSSAQTRLQVNQDFLTLASNAGQAGASMSGTNQQSITLGESFFQTISDIRQHADAMVQDGDSARQVRDYIQQVIAKLAPYAKGNQDAAAAVRNLTTYVDGLTKSLSAIPKSEQVGIKVIGTGDWTVVSNRNPASGPGGGHQLTRAAGGLVSGPGGPTGDKIPLWGSDGEFMMQASAVDRYGLAFMEAVNAQRLASGGPVTGHYSGSVAGLPAWDAKELAATTTAIEKAVAAAVIAGVSAPGGASGFPGGPAAPGTSAAAAQAYAASILGLYGWGQGQMPPLISLWNQESGWRWDALNPSSGAYGIPQSLPASKMAAAGPDWRTNPATQIRWGLGYIHDRYGSPAAAEGHELAYHWYDSGGWLPPGVSLAVNQTGQPERVLAPRQSGAPAGPAQVINNNFNYIGTHHPTPEQEAIMMRTLAMTLSGL